MHTTAEKRHNDWKKAIRKREIDRNTQGSSHRQDMYDNLHQYSKNKVHCSCPLCNAKTRKTKKPYGHGGKGGKNWSHADRQKIDEMENQELDNE